MPNECLTNRAEGQPEPVSDDRLDHADHRHFQTGRPPGADGDERLDRADREVGQRC